MDFQPPKNAMLMIRPSSLLKSESRPYKYHTTYISSLTSSNYSMADLVALWLALRLDVSRDLITAAISGNPAIDFQVVPNMSTLTNSLLVINNVVTGRTLNVVETIVGCSSSARGMLLRTSVIKFLLNFFFVELRSKKLQIMYQIQFHNIGMCVKLRKKFLL